MNYKDLVLSLCDEHLGLKCMEIIQLERIGHINHLLLSDTPYAETLTILKQIARGKIFSVHFSSSEAERVLNIIGEPFNKN